MSSSNLKPIAVVNTPVPAPGPTPPPKPPKRRSLEVNEPVNPPALNVENSPTRPESKTPPVPPKPVSLKREGESAVKPAPIESRVHDIQKMLSPTAQKPGNSPTRPESKTPPLPPKPVSLKREGESAVKPVPIESRVHDIQKAAVISPTAQKPGNFPKDEQTHRETPSPNPDHHENHKGHHEASRMIPMSMAILRSSVYMERRKSVKMKDGHEDKALLVGTLSKRNRDGIFEKCIFTLTKDSIMYQKQLPTTQLAEDTVILEEECKVIPLEIALVTPLKEGDYDDAEKRPRAFRFLSKHKSFLLRAKTVEMKEEWFQAIQGAVLQARIASTSTVSLTEADMAPIWNPNEDKCSICLTPFTFFVRKHHCRNCGICVCELCSKDKVRIPKLDERQLYKVCTHCGKILKEARTYGFQSELTA